MKPKQWGGKVTMSVFISAALVLLGLFLVYTFLTKKEKFQNTGAKVIYFYNENCGYCQRFDPEWKKFEQQAPDLGVLTQKVRPTDDVELAKKYNVQGTPTIIMILPEGSVDLSGFRTADLLAENVSKKVN